MGSAPTIMLLALALLCSSVGAAKTSMLRAPKDVDPKVLQVKSEIDDEKADFKHLRMVADIEDAEAHKEEAAAHNDEWDGEAIEKAATSTAKTELDRATKYLPTGQDRDAAFAAANGEKARRFTDAEQMEDVAAKEKTDAADTEKDVTRMRQDAAAIEAIVMPPKAVALISPEVPGSSNKFFKKDYPFDKRPVADPFHFHHPYPVVQDGGDFDRDFVKDENSDNGSWKAQETYDRLRVKLGKEKKAMAKAFGKKQDEEKNLKDAMTRHEKEARDRENARKNADRIRRAEEKRLREEDAAEAKKGSKKDSGKKGPAVQKPKTKAVSQDMDVSTGETEKAMRNLEDCKKQLAKARQELKDLMKELEGKKLTAKATSADLDDAMKREISGKEHLSAEKREVKSEGEEYQDAKANYAKQQALVDKLERDIKVAAAKVKAMRDASDKDGGVYPTPDDSPRPKSGVPAAHWISVPALALVVALLASY